MVQEGSRESICEAFKIVRDNLDFMDTEKKTVGKGSAGDFGKS